MFTVSPRQLISACAAVASAGALAAIPASAGAFFVRPCYESGPQLNIFNENAEGEYWYGSCYGAGDQIILVYTQNGSYFLESETATSGGTFTNGAVDYPFINDGDPNVYVYAYDVQTGRYSNTIDLPNPQYP